MDILHDTDWEQVARDNKYFINCFQKVVRAGFIPEKPFSLQWKFLLYPSEDLFFGGAAGGSKSSSLLMSALAYVLETGSANEPVYNAVIIRKTYADLSQPNAIMDRAEYWLLPAVSDGLVHYDRKNHKFTFPTGNTLSFGYLSSDKDLQTYQGAEFQFIGIDEATRIPSRYIRYLHSRLRKTEDNPIPLRFRYTGNPGGVSNDYFRDTFVYGDLPFIPAYYTDNPYLNHAEYKKQLEMLDDYTKQQLMHGNWDVVVGNGLLASMETLQGAVVNTVDGDVLFSVVGIDPAGKGHDKFAITLVSYYTNNKYVVEDIQSVQSSTKLDRFVLSFLHQHKDKLVRVVNFEREPGSDSEFALRYWRDLITRVPDFRNVSVVNTPASSSKFIRAQPVSNAVEDGHLFFKPCELLSVLFNQFQYVHPDKGMMSDFASPDELDSLGYAFNYINMMNNGVVTVNRSRERVKL